MPSKIGLAIPPIIDDSMNITSEATIIPIAKLSLRNGTLDNRLVTLAMTTGVINTAEATAIISLDLMNDVNPPSFNFGFKLPRTILNL